VARNVPENRRTSSRVTKSPVGKQQQQAAPVRPRRDRRQFWIQFVAALLVLFMLLPVVAFFF
jgi:type VI protein secretion system component VasF